MKKSVLISERTHEVLAQRLREAGFEVSVEPDHDYESLVKAAQGCEGLVVRSKVHIDSHFIDCVPSLRCIGRVGAGMETIDVDYAEAHGVRCLNSPEGNRDAVGEHAVGLLLALLNNIARADAEVRQGVWRREANRGYELGPLTVGIIGFGNMGQAFAKRLGGFGCRVIYYDKYLPIDTIETIDVIERVPLEILQQEADVVSFHVPLTEETRHYLDTEFIEAMAKPFYLVNTARGAVVNTDALVEGLESGKVRGVALDVLEYENMQADGLGDVPESMKYLMQSSRTVLTPHIAGWTVESKYKLAAVLADKMIEVLK
jgi:D-3-phosphoglycerate dehydrogenase